MAKVVLGKTPQDLEAEKAKKNRELEAEIQQKALERNKKIQALHNKQKSNKIIIILVVSFFAIVLVVFGTYNTFFKKGLSIDDVNLAIAQSIQQSRYPSEGLDNYIRDNCETLFKKYMSLDNQKAKNIAKVEVDKDSCTISKVRKYNSSFAEVFFSVNVTVTENDTEVTDPVVIEQLKRNGFGIKSEVTNTQSKSTTEAATTESTNTESTNTENITTEANDNPVVQTANNTDESVSENTEEQTKPQTETDATEATTEDSSVPITDIDYSSGSDENATNVHYYMTEGGQIMQEGTSTTVRYNFFVPVTYEISYDNDGTAMYGAYKVVGDMDLYSLTEQNQSNFDEIVPNDYYAFNEDALYDEDTLHNIQIRIDKTLDSLYSYKNTEAEYKLYLPFNTYDATYDGIISLEAYNTPNALGYNAKVSYKITTTQGFSYTLQTYMRVEPDGNSWVIKDIM